MIIKIRKAHEKGYAYSAKKNQIKKNARNARAARNAKRFLID